MNARVAIVAGAGGALGHATTTALAARGLTVVAVDRNERGLSGLPGGVRREVADTTDPGVVRPLIYRIAAHVGSLACWSTPSARSGQEMRSPQLPRRCGS